MLGCLAVAPVSAQHFADPGFSGETVATLPQYQPVGLAWAPDGRMFIWQKNGTVRILKHGTLVPTPFLDIGDHLNTAHDRGLLGLALDPDFESNGYVYLLYTFEPASGSSGFSGPRSGRLTRVKADPDEPDRALPGSETIILGKVSGPCPDSLAGSDCIATDVDSHGVGALLFAPDGKLFVSIGDGTDYLAPDPRSFRAQDLDRYEGKLLRIDPDGSAPGDNPFDDGTQSIRSKIYAYGLRNPFRFALDSRGEPYVGDVGSDRFEEIDRGRGANFGWPCWEGNDPNWYRVGATGFGDCHKLDSTVAKTAKPVFAYGRESGNSVIAGDFNPGSRYPDSLRGELFYGDYATGKLMRLRMDSTGAALDAKEFATEAGAPVCLRFGPDGYLYYVAYSIQGAGQVRRIGYKQPEAGIRGSRSRPSRSTAPVFDAMGRNRSGKGRLPSRGYSDARKSLGYGKH